MHLQSKNRGDKMLQDQNADPEMTCVKPNPLLSEFIHINIESKYIEYYHSVT